MKEREDREAALAEIFVAVALLFVLSWLWLLGSFLEATVLEVYAVFFSALVALRGIWALLLLAGCRQYVNKEMRKLKASEEAFRQPSRLA